MSDLSGAITVFGTAAAVVVGFGVYLTILADELAERSSLSRAFVGAVLLGALTSLAEIGTSISAALAKHPELAVTNAVGSVAAQTVFIAVADLVYRRANLEHAAASAANLLLCAVLILLLGVTLLGVLNPDVELFSMHPTSYVLVAAYLFGMHLVTQSGEMPMWQPHRTRETNDEADRTIQHSGPMLWLWARFLFAGAVVAGAGVTLARTGIRITQITGLSESFVGVLLTGVVSSMPELITAVTAVRIGALTLAISNILGGNAFDVIIVALSDMAYREGSIFQGAGPDLATTTVATLLMAVVTLLGLLRRERHGVANIGLEGALLICLYAGLVYALVDRVG